MSSQRQSYSSWLKTVVLLFLAVILPSSGQQIGIDVCSCAPSDYEFQFDFTLFCPPINITQGDAVTSTSCMVSPFEDPAVGDLVPVAVQEIVVLELDQNLDVLVREEIAGNFKDGDTFRYTSVAAEPGSIVEPRNLPRAIQYNIVGINILDQTITNIVLITFSNSCQAYPVLIPGQYAGWVRFIDLEEPIQDYCPLAPDMPSAAPTTASTIRTPAPTPFGSMSMSMSMDYGVLDLLDDEFGREYGCTESSSKGSKSRGKSGKGEEAKGSKKLGKGGSGKGGSSSYSSSSDSSKTGKSGKGESRRELSSKGSKKSSSDDCDGTKKSSKGKSGKGKAGKSGKSGKGKGESGSSSSKTGKSGKGNDSGSGSGSGSKSSKKSGSSKGDTSKNSKKDSSTGGSAKGSQKLTKKSSESSNGSSKGKSGKGGSAR